MNESSLAAGMVPGVLALFGMAVVLGIVTLVCFLFSSKGGRESGSRNFSEAFDELLCRYGLVGKADLKKELNVNDRYRFTLLRKITHESERFLPLPDGFVKEMRALVDEFYGDMSQSSTKKELAFRVREQGMTDEEIRLDQEEWDCYVRMCLAGDD